MRFIIVYLSFIGSLMAGETNRYSVCPNVTEDAKVILTSIQTLQDELRKTPECQSVSGKISTLSSIINDKAWGTVRDTLRTSDAPQLEADEVVKVTAMVEKATFALSDIVSQLSSGSSNCLPPENRASFLASLSGIVKDVSGVVGNVTGPYGAAISLGGSLLSGVISGIDRLYKRDMVYDFRKPAEELLFMNQFCAFSQAQQDINDFLQLQEKEKDLLKLEMDYLRNSKIKDLIENCQECNAYKIAWDANEAATRIVERIVEDANIVVVSTHPENRASFTRCAEINRAFYSDESDFNQLIGLFEKYLNPMTSVSDEQQLSHLTSAMWKMRDIYPPYEKCIAMDNEAISIKFNNFMRDEVLRLTSTIFGQQMKHFKNLANRNYRDTTGDYIASSLDRAKWAREERLRVIKKIKEPNYEASKEFVIKSNLTLKARLVDRLMPGYLKFRFKDNKTNIKDFVRKFTSFRKDELSYFNARMTPNARNIKELTSRLQEEKYIHLGRYFVSAYDQMFQTSKLIVLKVSNNVRYCDYLLYSRSMTNANREICSEGIREINAQLRSVAHFDVDVNAIAEFDQWAEKNLSIQSSFVKDYADHISDWNARGDSRWERVVPPAILPLSAIE
jgi:hypothetical protein